MTRLTIAMGMTLLALLGTACSSRPEPSAAKPASQSATSASRKNAAESSAG